MKSPGDKAGTFRHNKELLMQKAVNWQYLIVKKAILLLTQVILNHWMGKLDYICKH